jgi:transcriptional regulator with XRE-family HTH domain
MTMIDTARETNGKLRPLTPEEIGALVRTVRTMQGWTQETLAELSSLQTRTIQRVEQGQPSSLDTRRALARGFGLDDLDYFNALRSFPTEEELQKQKEAFERDYLLLDTRAVDGRQLLALMQDGPGFGAICATSVAEIPRAAQNAFAAIADFVRDCMDVFDVATRTEILGYGDTLDESIAELKTAGFCLCAAFRDTKLTNKSWTDQTPQPCRITYLLAGPKDQPPAKVAVARKISGGF